MTSVMDMGAWHCCKQGETKCSWYYWEVVIGMMLKEDTEA